ncbi:MAG: Na/Pi cotransporter family protein [Bacteroidales bacterium]|nr:Na/Pi cotransporter family protein [Bacteroidales bacterium]
MSTTLVLTNFLTLIGALVLFLIGMKLMSEALQKVAGSRMRSILGALTSNKLRGLLTGALVTSGIQSSSATSVMVVSFVNAGLLSLSGAIAVIMGANIGTTITAWMISIIGFNLKLSALSLPLIGLSFPLFFSNKSKRKSWGEFIIGFALLFLGLQYMKDLIPDIKHSPDVLNFLSAFVGNGYLSIIAFVFFGMIITVILQSSSATMALTIVLAYNGLITYELAIAMIIGENIGTTATANIAAFVANGSGKIAARAHFVFNVLGAIWALLLFYPLIQFVDLLANSFHFQYETTSANGLIQYDSLQKSLPLKLALFHTVFNLSNSLLLIWFVPQIKSISSRLVSRKSMDEISRLKYINSGILSTSELSMVQAKKEISILSGRIIKMFDMVPKIILEKKEDKYNDLLESIKKYEKISDNMEVEIANYITKISEQDLSKRGSRRLRSMLKMIDDLESIADSIYQMARSIDKKNKQKVWFNQDHRNNLNQMIGLTAKALKHMHNNLDAEARDVTIDYSTKLEIEINLLRDRLIQENIEKINQGEYPYLSGNYYATLISALEKIGDYVINVNEAIIDSNR